MGNFVNNDNRNFTISWLFAVIYKIPQSISICSINTEKLKLNIEKQKNN